MGCKKFRIHIELMFYNDGSRRMGVKGIMSFRSRTGSRLIILIASSTNNKRICLNFRCKQRPGTIVLFIVLSVYLSIRVKSSYWNWSKRIALIWCTSLVLMIIQFEDYLTKEVPRQQMEPKWQVGHICCYVNRYCIFSHSP